MAEATKHRGTHSRGSHGGGGHHDDHGGGGGGGGGGKLVKVGFARNQAEAEMLQGLLTESGIPSILKRSGGFDAPEFLAAGPRDIWVNRSHATEARRILEETMTLGDDEAEERAEMEGEARLRATDGDSPTPARLALWVGGALIVAIVIIWIVYEVSG